MKDTIRDICNILQIHDSQVVTFEDYIELRFGKSYKELKNEKKIKELRDVWNTSCESLLNVLDGINMLAKKFEKKENGNGRH